MLFPSPASVSSTGTSGAPSASEDVKFVGTWDDPELFDGLFFPRLPVLLVPEMELLEEAALDAEAMDAAEAPVVVFLL